MTFSYEFVFCNVVSVKRVNAMKIFDPPQFSVWSDEIHRRLVHDCHVFRSEFYFQNDDHRPENIIKFRDIHLAILRDAIDAETHLHLNVTMYTCPV